MWKLLVAVALLTFSSQPSTLVGTSTLMAVEKINADGTSPPQPLARSLLVVDGAFELAESGRRTPYAANQPTATEGFSFNCVPTTL